MDRAKSYCLMLLLAIAQIAGAETIQELLDAGRLEARALIKTAEPHYQKAPIEIVVEVGTPDRFKDGTRVRDFTVAGTLVRRLTKSAFNESRRVDGDRWDFQSWRFELHAELLGELTIPPLRISISVDTEADGLVEGEIELSVPRLEIEVAPGTEALDSWVAANSFKIEESWEGELERYEIGDAITRVRTFTIQGAPAMSIPASTLIELKGIDLYQAPAKVDDEEVGGMLQGVREERVVFTFKGGGDFSIPDDRIEWFKLEAGTVETIELPGRSFEVAGPPVPAAKSEPTAGGDPERLWPWLLAGLGIGLGFLLSRVVRRSLWLRQLRDGLEAGRDRRRLKSEFLRAAAQHDSHACIAMLYEGLSERHEWQLSAACGGDRKLREALDGLMAHAFDNGPPVDCGDVELLWEVCKPPKDKRKPEQRGALSLNPSPSRNGST